MVSRTIQTVFRYTNQHIIQTYAAIALGAGGVHFLFEVTGYT